MLGARIASLRNRLGWSQAELARRLNISPSAVGMYEQGRREPSADMLVAIARVLGVSTEFLLTGRGLSQGDWWAMRSVSGDRIHSFSVPEALKCLSREELIILLTASLFGMEGE